MEKYRDMFMAFEVALPRLIAATTTDETRILRLSLPTFSNAVGLSMMSMFRDVTPSSESLLMTAAVDRLVLSVWFLFTLLITSPPEPDLNEAPKMNTPPP